MKSNINIVVGTSTINADARTFSTGSLGFYANGKAVLTVGAALAPINIVVDGQSIIANPRKGASEKGNFGWYGSGKVVIDGQRHQVGINITLPKCNGVLPANTVVNCQVGGNIILIGSKPGSAAKTGSKKGKRQLQAANVVTPTARVITPPAAPQTVAPSANALDSFMAFLRS